MPDRQNDLLEPVLDAVMRRRRERVEEGWEDERWQDEVNERWRSEVVDVVDDVRSLARVCQHWLLSEEDDVKEEEKEEEEAEAKEEEGAEKEEEEAKEEEEEAKAKEEEEEAKEEGPTHHREGRGVKGWWAVTGSPLVARRDAFQDARPSGHHR